MRLAIYVPSHQAERWGDGMSFEQFQVRVIEASGGITLTQANLVQHLTKGWIEPQPVQVVEALLRIPSSGEYAHVWELFRSYAHQLLAQGEKSVLIVQDNEPTFIT